MTEKINIAEILKDCPKGMELDCLMYNNLYFDEIDEDCRYPVGCYTIHNGHRISANFTKFGEFNNYGSAKCVIFPKGKTTWEGFVPSCKFNDGDICYIKTEVFEHIFIFKVNEDYNVIQKYVNLSETYFYTDKSPICSIDAIKEIRLATEEEKTKLFDAIKANGYKWNPETKTLEKLVEPKFKIGDRVRNKNYKDYIYDIHDITDKGYRAKEINADSPIIILFGSQEDNYELVPNKFDITTLIPFESRVLVRDNVDEVWLPCFFGGFSDINGYPYRIVGGDSWKYCIPYEGNEHLLGKTDDCDEYYKNW